MRTFKTEGFQGREFVAAIAIAIPVFLATMLVEWRLLLRRGDSDYRFEDTFSNLACGVGSQLWGALSAIVSWYAYTLIADSVMLLDWWTGGAGDWVLAILAIDLSYYWFHRISHRVRFFWSFHVVHHQSESYNLSVALRQSWFGGFVSWIFYTPWLMLGIPPTPLIVAKLVNLLYQYWIHTRLIDQLPFGLEWIMSSPSNHRVHHGRDDRSLDTNYGGIFIVWDRIFGTYVAESEEPPYGTVSPIKAWDPVHANLEGFQKMGEHLRASKSVKQYFLSIFGPPEWQPPLATGGEQERLSLYQGTSSQPSTVLRYVVIQFFVSTGWLLIWLSGRSTLGDWPEALLSASVILGLWAWGALLGSSATTWVVLEGLRLGLIGAAAWMMDGLVMEAWLATGLLAAYFLLVALEQKTRSKEAPDCP